MEARMTSSRLPGKVLLKALKGMSMLEFMINRVKRAKLIDEIVIATTINETDEPIVNLCDKLNVKYYRGSEKDVLLRVLNAHKKFKSDVIVELTGDCPLIDPNIVDEIILFYIENNYDYVSNSHLRSYPDGFDVQVFSTKLLSQVSSLTKNKYDRENVSSYIYRTNKYNIYGIVAPKELFWPNLRVTLDDKGDYLLIKKIIKKLHREFGFSFRALDVINYLRKNLHLLDLIKDSRTSNAPYQLIANGPRD
ncbi:MAG: glycosyltransferase family protein [Bacteroidota bacterium]|nr:glycosyltransferase family protein [Bacteroidota bacterium]